MCFVHVFGHCFSCMWAHADACSDFDIRKCAESFSDLTKKKNQILFTAYEQGLWHREQLGKNNHSQTGDTSCIEIKKIREEGSKDFIYFKRCRAFQDLFFLGNEH